jgi:hypothetical protein
MTRSRTEVLLALELVALASFAFSRPVLAVFGEIPQLFVSRNASRADIIGFALVVTLVPATIVALVGAASGVLGARARHVTHVVLVAVCGGLGTWRAVHDPTGGRTWALSGLAVGAIGAGVVGLLRTRDRTRDVTARFLRFASLGAVVFVVQFLWLSPVGASLLVPAAGVDEEVVAEVAQALGPAPPPVVFVVLDELPTISLLDGRGEIDQELYPHFAALASDATWYRNHTTVATHTVDAIPAILTGRYRSPGDRPVRPDGENVFSLLSGRYDMAVEEPVTRLCTGAQCPSGPSAIDTLASDAIGWWQRGLTWEMAEDVEVPTLPGATGPGRYDRAEQTIEGLDLRRGGAPTFSFLHLMLPHGPWQYTDDGTLYARPDATPGATIFTWTDVGYEVGRQRHLLQVQATDALLGQLIDELRAADVYDDALIVVTADHGVSFAPGAPTREVVAGNEEQILWTPLLVKAPGQTRGEVDDSNVLSIDILPTVAGVLGIEIPWEVDGAPAGSSPPGRAPGVKPLVDPYVPAGEVEPAEPVDGLPYVEIDAEHLFSQVLATDPVPATGPDAVWRLTRYGAVVGADVDGLPRGAAVDGTVTVGWPPGLDDVDTGEPLPLAVVAGTDQPVGTVVAFALNGTVGALGEVQDGDEPGGKLVQGMVLPWLVEDGANALEAFVVTGDPAAPTLQPLDVSL